MEEEPRGGPVNAGRPPSLLSGYRLLDLAGPMASYCGRLLADLGADVLKVEPPEGDPGRAYPPFFGDRPGPETSLSFIFRNTGKRCLRLDLETAAGRATLAELIGAADFVVDTCPPGALAALGLDPRWFSERGRTIWVSVSHFGQEGPRAGEKGSDLVDFARSGSMHLSGLLGEPPCNAPGPLAYEAAGTYAALAMLIALRHRQRTGEGQFIDLAVEDAALAGLYPWALANHGYDARGLMPARRLSAESLPLLECQDGYVRFNLFLREHWRAFVAMLGDPEVLLQPEWDAYEFRAHHYDLLRVLALELTASRTRQALFEEAQARGVGLTPVKTPDEYIADPQTVARRFFTDLPHPRFGTLRVPGRPFRLSAAELAPLRPPEVIEEAPAEWREARPDPPGPPALQGRGEPGSEARAAPARPLPFRPVPTKSGEGGRGVRSALPLAGIRVVEFSGGAAVPELGMALADFGAEVIKVESRANFDFIRVSAGGVPAQPNASANFNASNFGKRSVCLDMRTAGARAIAIRLLKLADVVAENNRVGVMERWGLDYEAVRAINPQIVMLRSSGFGLDGPYREYASTGPAQQALCGLTALWRHPTSDIPAGSLITYPDHLASKLGAALVLAALDWRRRTGEGQLIELCQVETMAALGGEPYLEWTVNGRKAAPLGNRSPVAAPQGAYPAAGEDRWLALTVADDAEWRALCAAIGAPALADRYPTLADRQAGHDAIDAVIAEWSRVRSAEEATAVLQAAGVAAAPVCSAADQANDPHLLHRRAVEEVDHPETGRRRYAGNPMRFSRTPAPPRRPSPLLGEATREVCRELLGLTADEFERYEAEGVFF